MRAVIQRVKQASVTIEGKIYSSIAHGLLVLIGIEKADNYEDVEWITSKIVSLRIFDDEQGIMNLSVKETGGEILAVSQFTLHAQTKKGNRPSYINAAKSETAIPLYKKFVQQLETDLGKSISTGIFQAMMDVALINNGPVTIWMDTKNKE